MNKKAKKENLYSLLGVSKDAELQEIKSAYKKLALKWHPDKNGGSEESTIMFQKISEAYAVLSNPQRRKKYDMWGETGPEEDDDPFTQMFGDMDDLFGGGFGADMDDFDEFIKILEGDSKQFKNMFRGLGKNYRTKQGRARGGKNTKKNNKKEEQMMEEMMAMMMMGDMMQMAAGMDSDDDIFTKKPKKSTKKAKQEESDGWETDEADEITTKKKVEAADDEWEDCSD